MATVTPTARADRKLQLKEVLDWLVEDGMVEAADVAKMAADARIGGQTGRRHPVTVISEARLRSKKPPNAVLNADNLIQTAQ